MGAWRFHLIKDTHDKCPWPTPNLRSRYSKKSQAEAGVAVASWRPPLRGGGCLSLKSEPCCLLIFQGPWSASFIINLLPSHVGFVVINSYKASPRVLTDVSMFHSLQTHYYWSKDASTTCSVLRSPSWRQHHKVCRYPLRFWKLPGPGPKKKSTSSSSSSLSKMRLTQ
jgi:hypothetical protein